MRDIMKIWVFGMPALTALFYLFTCRLLHQKNSVTTEEMPISLNILTMINMLV